jgi:hypothetical protein
VRLLSVALVALLLAACGGGKPDEAAKSWRATLQMTAEKWVDNSVPARFVRATCDSAQKALKENPEAAPVLAAATKLRDAAERGDRNAARRIAEELRRQ